MVSGITTNAYVPNSQNAAKANKTEATQEVTPKSKAEQIAKAIDEGTYKLLPPSELAKVVAEKINF